MTDERCLIRKDEIAKGLEFENKGQLDDAYRCYYDAAECGNPLAMFMIGNMYFYKKYRGKEIPVLKMVMMPWDKQTQIVPDLATAYSWFLKSAQSGFPDAMSNVGTMCYFGQGVEQNREKSKEWLIKASKSGSSYGIKALKDFFGIDYSKSMSDEEYNEILDQFCKKVESHEPNSGELYQKLILGNDRQLCRLGYRIAVGRYHIDEAYREIGFPTKSNGRSCAPVSRVRIGWINLLIVNRNAFPEEKPIISISVDGYPSRAESIQNAIRDSRIKYTTDKEWGWHPSENCAQCFKLLECDKPGDGIEEAISFSGIEGLTMETIIEKISPSDDEALLIDASEKEYSMEICHVYEGKAISILRYTDGGYNQGDLITSLPIYQIDDEYNK